VLEETEVDACRVVIEHFANRVVGQELSDSAHGARVDEGVVHEQDKVAARGLVDEAGGQGRCGREGLLDEHVLSGL
jgi:hypothetical protein